MQKIKFIVAAIVLFVFSAAQAVVWSNPTGNADFFDWQNGQSLYGLFGDPILVGGNNLVFFPSMFRAESLDRETNSVSDSLEFELTAHSGFSFQNISITEYGNYGISGSGLVQVSGALSVENLDTADTLSSSLITDLPERPPADPNGQWQAWTYLDIVPAGWTHIKITLENNLFAISGSGSSAWIEKNVLSNAIAVQLIPEPATVAMLSIGVMFTLYKSRKRQYKA
ncbi:MAG: PEP-CTERM sorting domain-containing protein [Phycisphaerae bacterium]|nr:PEP-CTERM sorting domain-containing protein [Phycisphaerae bacterium]